MLTIDLNCDLGEGMPTDEAVLPYMTSANIACGAHAGSRQLMEKTVRLCRQYGVSAGAHPGFKDPENFGRTEMRLSENELYDLVFSQVLELGEICASCGMKLSHVKPHGALYNMACKDPAMAKVICRAAKDCSVRLGMDPYILAPGAGCFAAAAAKEGLALCSEVFADRAYEEDGSLVSRKKEGSVITDEALAISRTLGMVREGSVLAFSGKRIIIRADSVCIHGDNPKAVEFAKEIHRSFVEAGIMIRPFSRVR